MRDKIKRMRDDLSARYGPVMTWQEGMEAMKLKAPAFYDRMRGARQPARGRFYTEDVALCLVAGKYKPELLKSKRCG